MATRICPRHLGASQAVELTRDLVGGRLLDVAARDELGRHWPNRTDQLRATAKLAQRPRGRRRLVRLSNYEAEERASPVGNERLSVAVVPAQTRP